MNMLQERQDELVDAFHIALNSFKTQVYNGQEFPVDKTFPEALLDMSKDLRTVKNDLTEIKDTVNDHKELLQGISHRKKISKSFVEGIDYFKESALGKIMAFFFIVIPISLTLIVNWTAIEKWLISIF